MSQVLLGANITENEPLNSGIKVGAIFTAADGKKYMRVQVAANITQYAHVSIDENGQATMLTKALLDTRTNIGCCQVALTSGNYGWAQVEGNYTGLVKASCVLDAKLYSSATPGYLDDDLTSQTAVLGAVVTTTRGGTDGTTAMRFTALAQTA